VRVEEEGGMEQVIILGSGPAGLTAAIYAARANLRPLVIGGYLAGGQLMTTTEVENFPGFPEGVTGPELMAHFRAQAERFGARIEDIDATSVDIENPHSLTVETPDGKHKTHSLIIATGASARWLGIPGEERLRGRGVSSCATCDGAFFPNKRLAVVGGGDSAMEEAIFLTRFASEVVIVHRNDRLRASKIMADRAQNHAKIRFIWNALVDEVHGDAKVEALTLRSTIDGSITNEPFDGLFVAIGHDPNTVFLQGQLSLDDRGYILSDDGVRTSQQGVFVAGDVFDQRYRQAITASGSGCRAAIEAERYLEGLVINEHASTY
jgi:thioredoxin reductase (NADPH)